MLNVTLRPPLNSYHLFGVVQIIRDTQRGGERGEGLRQSVTETFLNTVSNAFFDVKSLSESETSL